jgi:hypothetical protein
MKKTKWLGAALCLSASLAQADHIIPHGTPTINGEINPTEWAEKSHIRMARFYGFDQFADFWLQWDESNLYIAGQLQDYTLFEDSGVETWHDDSIEIYLHPSTKLSSEKFDKNSRVLAFTINGKRQRLDRGSWNGEAHSTVGLEIFGNTTEKIGNSFLNKIIKSNWVCPHVQPAQTQPTNVIVKFKSKSNGTINDYRDRDQDWTFEAALPWELLGTTVGSKIVDAGCLTGTGIMPSKLTPNDGMSLRMNFYRVNDDNGGTVNPTPGNDILDQRDPNTGEFNQPAPSGTLTDEWFVYQGDRFHPKEWANFVLSDQRAKDDFAGPIFSNTTLNKWEMDGRRVRLSLTAPQHSVSGKAASRYEIRTQLGEIAVVDEGTWASMQTFENAYQPAQPGTTQNLDVIGLQPGQTYTIALRAVDELERSSSQILSTTVKLWADETKFVTVSPTGRSLVFTDGTPFTVVGETGLMPWLPLRGLYDGELCDEDYPPEEKLDDKGNKVKVDFVECNGGKTKGKVRNYHQQEIFRCYENEKPIHEIHLNSDAEPQKLKDFEKDRCAGENQKVVQIEGYGVAEEYFGKLKAAGVNVLTVFVESLDLNVTPIFFEPSKGQYNEAALKFLDRLVALARDNDVYLIIRLYDTYYYKEKWYQTYWATELNKNEPKDFFDEDLYLYHQARMQVLFDRYEKEPHILGWDLLNEVDNKDRFNQAKFEDRKRWLKDMLAYAKSKNPYHLMFYSFLTWDPKDDDDSRARLGMDAELAYRVPYADLAVPHGYYAHIAAPGRNAPSGYEKPLELARGIAYGFHQIRDGRPILDGEGGPSPLFINKYDDSKFTDDDDKEMFLNSAWLHFVSGGAGANLRWPIDLDSDATINQFSVDWRLLLKVFKDTIGDIPWRGHHLNISRRELGNGIMAMTRYDGRNAVSYWYNPQKAGLHDITLPEFDDGWANVKMVNPRTGDLLLSQGGFVGSMSSTFTIPVEFNDHLVIVVQRVTALLEPMSDKSTWSKSTDPSLDLWLKFAFPFAQEDVYFWLQDSNGVRQYMTFSPDFTLNQTRLPIFRRFELGVAYWGDSNVPLLPIPMSLLEVGQYQVGTEVGGEVFLSSPFEVVH